MRAAQAKFLMEISMMARCLDVNESPVLEERLVSTADQVAECLDLPWAEPVHRLDSARRRILPS